MLLANDQKEKLLELLKQIESECSNHKCKSYCPEVHDLVDELSDQCFKNGWDSAIHSMSSSLNLLRHMTDKI